MTNMQRWLELAGDDVRMAELAMAEGILHQVCFHSEQAAEKLLKAYLVSRKGSYPKTHSLIQLFHLCRMEDSGFEDLAERCEFLDQFYIATRYPDAPIATGPAGSPSMPDAEKAMSAATYIRTFVLSRIGS